MKINEVMKILKDNGYKFTEQRKAIVESIYKENKYVSAKEILHQVQQKYPGVSFDTIYRNLTILSNLNLIEESQFGGEAKYKASCIGNHHHHLICTVCGKTIILPDCPLDLLQGIAGDFQVTGHKFEIQGLCKQCQVSRS